MPVKKGTKQNIDLAGDPYINVMLAVLARAKKDGERRHGRCNLMWAKFKEDYPGYLDMINIDPLGKAEWVIEFILKYGVMDYCLSVKDKETERELRGKQNANL